MQNPDQTRILYKPGHTRLTRTKPDPDNPTLVQCIVFSDITTACSHTLASYMHRVSPAFAYDAANL